MLRASIVRSARAIATQRAFTTSRAVMGAGDTGGIRSGGERAGDAYTRREQGNEAQYIREEERRKLLELKQKLAAQRKHVDELAKTIDEMTKEHGGEHN